MGITISNFFTWLLGKTKVKIVMVGLGGAGKTTILYRFKIGDNFAGGVIPTVGFNVETLTHKNISLSVWDVGGGCKAQALWCHYYKNTSAIILVIDSTNRERLGEIRDITKNLLYTDELHDAVIFILANKQDLPDGINVEELTNRLELNAFSNRRWYVHPTCALKGVGLDKALDWLATELTK